MKIQSAAPTPLALPVAAPSPAPTPAAKPAPGGDQVRISDAGRAAAAADRDHDGDSR